MRRKNSLLVSIILILSLTSCSNFFDNIFYADTTTDPKEEKSAESTLGKVKWNFSFNNQSCFFQITDLEKNEMTFSYDGNTYMGTYIVNHDGKLVFREDSLKYNIYLRDFKKNEMTLIFQLGLNVDYSTTNWTPVSATTDGTVPEPPAPDPSPAPDPKPEPVPDPTDPTDPSGPTV